MGKVSTTESFIRKSIEIHGDKYEYSKTEYIRTHENVLITCRKHGVFAQRPSMHMRGSGCPECAGKRSLTKTKQEEFLEKCYKKYGDYFDYSPSQYVNYHTKISIICPKHGLFEQSPANHLSNNTTWGCARCSWDNINWNPRSSFGLKGQYKDGSHCTLYIVIINDQFIKVGLALNKSRRFREIDRVCGIKITETASEVSGKANELFHLEQKILRYSGLQRHRPDVEFAGQSECLELSELPKVLEIIENWKKEKDNE